MTKEKWDERKEGLERIELVPDVGLILQLTERN